MTWTDELRKRMRGAVRAGELLSKHTTFRIGGPCDAFAEPSGIDGFVGALKFLREENINHIVIGQGSNVLFGDGGFRGCVLHAGSGISWVSIDGETVDAGAGALLGALVGRTAENGLAGVESLAGIPGTVGGAIRMNAGAFGQWISVPLQNVDFIDGAGEQRRMDKNEVGFRYRWSFFQEHPERVIISARFKLYRESPEALKKRISDINRQRRAKQPFGYPSAGSFFKNPEGEPAGALIDRAGLKGLRVGGAEVSHAHANFIINAGGATSADVVALAREVRRRVGEVFGVTLEPEVRIIEGWE